MNTYLYILVFENGNFLKIGISSIDFARIYAHNSTYKVDFKNSFIVTAPKERTIKNLEKHLLNLYDNNIPADYNAFDGYTEIRSIEIIDHIKQEILNQNPKLEISLLNLNGVIEQSSKSFIQKSLRKSKENNLAKKYKIKLYRLCKSSYGGFFYFWVNKDNKVCCTNIVVREDNIDDEWFEFNRTLFVSNRDIDGVSQQGTIFFITKDGGTSTNINLKEIKYQYKGKYFSKIQPLINEHLTNPSTVYEPAIW